MGWSLAAGLGSGKYAEGQQTSPGAGTTIAIVNTAPQDEYTINWQVELGGTLAAADANNMQLSVTGGPNYVAVCPAAAGIYPQEPVQVIVPAGGANVTVKAIGAATVGAVYTASFSMVGGAPMEVNILDGGQPLGQSAAPQGFADTQIMSDDGIYVSTSITITVVDGTVSGVIYVRDGIEPEIDK